MSEGGTTVANELRSRPVESALGRPGGSRQRRRARTVRSETSAGYGRRDGQERHAHKHCLDRTDERLQNRARTGQARTDPESEADRDGGHDDRMCRGHSFEGRTVSYSPKPGRRSHGASSRSREAWADVSIGAGEQENGPGSGVRSVTTVMRPARGGDRGKRAVPNHTRVGRLEGGEFTPTRSCASRSVRKGPPVDYARGSQSLRLIPRRGSRRWYSRASPPPASTARAVTRTER